MKIEVQKNGESQMIKERFLQNFIDQGWEPVKAKKSKPAVKVEATAEVKPVEPQWDLNEDWADSEESVIKENKGEA